jgi:hypothetical protein
MYGMEMGGFYPEYAFGGISRFDGGGNTKVRPTDIKAVDKPTYGSSTMPEYSDDKGKFKAEESHGNVEGRSEYNKKHADSGSGGGPFKGNLCTDMKTEGRKHYGKRANEVIFYAFPHLFNKGADGQPDPNSPRTTGWQATTYQNQLKTLQGCEVKGAVEYKNAIYTEDSPEEKCPDCIDPITGQVVTTGPDGKAFTRVKDANGVCTPCPTEECFCTDENGNKITVDCNDPCTKEEEYRGEATSGGQEVPFKPDPDSVVWADANMNPELIGHRGVQLEQYGIDPRAQANAAGAVTNKIIENQGQFSSNPGATLSNQLMAQAAGAPAIDAAFDQANKFNTQVRNQEIATNTAYRKDYLDKIPVYAQSYLGDVARKKENDARFFNEKQGKNYEMRQAQKKYATEMDWLQASNENIKWGGPDRGFYSVKTKDFSPTAGNTETAQRMKDLMNTYNIEDENVAYKLATAARYGGQYAEGGFVYSDNIFPYLL